MVARILGRSQTCSINRRGVVWQLTVYRVSTDHQECDEIACLHFGTVSACTLLRINSPCITSDVFGDEGRCDCNDQFNLAIDAIQKHGEGIVLYNTSEEGRGNGLFNKINTYAVSDALGYSSRRACEHLGLPVDARDYRYVAPILFDFGVENVGLITNNPEKLAAVERALDRVSRISCVSDRSSINQYLKSKKDDFAHYL